jgi:hypothetical protein
MVCRNITVALAVNAYLVSKLGDEIKQRREAEIDSGTKRERGGRGHLPGLVRAVYAFAIQHAHSSAALSKGEDELCSGYAGLRSSLAQHDTV